MSRSKRRKPRPAPAKYGGAPRKAGANRSRLNVTAAPSREIQERRAEARRPSAVTTRWVEPAPRVKNPDAPATDAQLDFIASLATELDVARPNAQTRQEASEAIGRLKQLKKRRLSEDSPPLGRERRSRGRG